MTALSYSATSSPNDPFAALCPSKPTLAGVRDTYFRGAPQRDPYFLESLTLERSLPKRGSHS